MEKNITAGLEAYEREDYAETEERFKAAAAIAEALEPQDQYLAMSLNNLAKLYSSQGRYADAEPLLVRTVAILEDARITECKQRCLWPVRTNLHRAIINLARLYRNQHKY
jgi:tetratricopeptide (TPR) repeat protein